MSRIVFAFSDTELKVRKIKPNSDTVTVSTAQHLYFKPLSGVIFQINSLVHYLFLQHWGLTQTL